MTRDGFAILSIRADFVPCYDDALVQFGVGRVHCCVLSTVQVCRVNGLVYPRVPGLRHRPEAVLISVELVCCRQI